MRELVSTTRFKKDYQIQKKRGRKIEKLRVLIDLLAAGGSLPVQYKDHPLKGQFQGSRECHVQGDWLLLYEISDDKVSLLRTGTHSDLFDE